MSEPAVEQGPRHFHGRAQRQQPQQLPARLVLLARLQLLQVVQGEADRGPQPAAADDLAQNPSCLIYVVRVLVRPSRLHISDVDSDLLQRGLLQLLVQPFSKQPHSQRKLPE